jgi:hypothetical protein
MRLQILTESASLKETPFDINAKFNIKSSKYSLNPEFNSDITKEFVKGLNVDKVKESVVASRPYISTFFSAILDRDYDTVLDVIYPVASMFVGKFSNNSAIVDEFKVALSIGKTYFEAVNKFLDFYKGIESDSSIVLRKVQAIYGRFKNNRAKVLDGLFTVYEEYLNTLKDGQETNKSKVIKQKLYAEYVKNQNLIENVLDEVASMSPKKTEDSPLKSINGKNYDTIRAFFEENRSDMKKISAKLLYLAYFDEILSREQGSLYSTSAYSKFTGKKDKNNILSELKSEISSKFDGEVQIGLSNEGFSLNVSTISSVDFPKLLDAVSAIAESGNVTLTFLEMYGEIKQLPMYSFYYAFDEVFGTKNFLENAAKLLDVESIKNVSSILANQPMPEDFDLGKYSFDVQGNSVVSNSISIKDSEKILKYVRIFTILKDLNLNDYETEVKSIVKRLAKNPDATFSVDDVLKSLRKSKGATFSVLTYNILKNALKSEESKGDVAYVIQYVAYESAIEGVELNKLFQQLFKKILITNQTEVINNMIRKTKGDDIKLDKIKELLLDYRNVLTSESLTRLGVTENAE